MVARISSSNNLYGALVYNQNKVEKGRAKIIFAHRMIENREGKFDMNTTLQSFEPYLVANRRTEKPVLHVSLNPDPKDTLSDERLSEIAEEYMQKTGYGDQPFIVYKHEDIERRHLHIVSLRVDENGRKMNDKFEYRLSMQVCRGLEEKYGLVPAERKLPLESLPFKKVEYEKGDLKHQIANVIRPVAESWHFQSFREYRALLSLFNVAVEEVSTPRGRLYNDFWDLEAHREVRGVVYSALNEKGEKVGNPFNSSLFRKEVGLDALKKRYEKSKVTMREKGLKERSKQVIAEALPACKSRPELERALEKQGMSVVFRTNGQGRIYGATFIDHRQKAVFNGSRLGKEFSANVFNEKFNETGICPGNTFKAGEAEQKPFQETGENANLGGIFSLLIPESATNDEIEERNLTRLMKKKKKQQHF
jgi:hypothetical protein